MKLAYNKKSDNPYYYIQEGRRVDGKVVTITVAKIGRHKDLLNNGIEDPLKYAYEKLKEYNDKAKKDVLSISLNCTPKKLGSDSKDDYKYSKSTALNVGYAYLKKIYNDLKINDFFDIVGENRRYKFDAALINEFLTYDRVLEPRSKYAALGGLENYFEKPKIQYQHILRYMDVLYENADKYIEHLYNNSENIVKRNTSVCYYDCTNFYFETEQEDEYIDEVTGEVYRGLRQYGVSKEHRPNPIIQMGLFIDSNGIPLSMGLYPGNTNEQTTVNELERKLLKMLKNKKIIYCADAGLASLNARQLNDMAGRAFIVTQSIKKLSNEIKNEVFKDDGYRLLSNNLPVSLADLKSFDKNKDEYKNLYLDKAYKVIEVDSVVDLGLFEEKTLKNGKTKLIKSNAKMKQRIIITYSRQMAEYQKNIRNNQIIRAESILKRGVDKRRKGYNDPARFIKQTNKNASYELDNEAISEEEKYDGFYAIATNLMDSNIKGILEINANRYKIEDCFRILKTNFSGRPAFHRKDPRLYAHFLICYAALLIYRLLDAKLKENGYHFTIDELLKTLQNMNINLINFNYYSSYTHSEVLAALEKTFNLQLDYDSYTDKTIKKILKKI